MNETTISKRERKAKPITIGVPLETSVEAETQVFASQFVEPDVAPEPIIEDMTMNETNQTNEAASAATHQAGQLLGDLQNRAKDAWTRSQAHAEEFAQFGRANMDAVVESARTAATGWQNIAAYSVEYAKTAVANANENGKRLASAKTPVEFAQTAQEIARANLDEAMAQTSKFAEGYLKLLGEIAQPLQNRYVVAADRMRTTIAA